VELDGPHESTVGGYLSEELARVPDPGETVELLEREAEVLEVEGTRIISLAMREPADAQR
jgi:CBS domain containing-hemolysin-like protein